MTARPPSAALFPGQGSSLGDADALIDTHCPELHARSIELLGRDPLAGASRSTLFAQPAIFLASIAGWRSLAAAGLEPEVFAGHSLGELSALTAAGVFAAQDGLELVVLRATLMADAAARTGDGGMLAVLKASSADAQRLAGEFGVVVANDNAEGQVVLSGPRATLIDVASAARQRGLRALSLDVTGAFHSPAMASAMEPFERAVRAVTLGKARAPVFCGMTAERFVDVPRELAGALCAPVRWRETMLALDRLGCETYLDVGPDEVLAQLAERIVPAAVVVRLGELHVGV